MSWEEDGLLCPDHRGAGDAHLANEVLGGLGGGGDGGVRGGGDVQHGAHHH